ncbi:MAG: type I methionyl aminopeptidase [Actinomycetales bacterium]
MFRRDRIQYKSDDQIRIMRRAGLVVADALAAACEVASRPGVTTAQVDAAAAETISAAGATSNFLGYGHPPFPAVTCISVNEEIVHGIPGDRVLAAGDLVSIDCGAVVDGWHGDAAVTVVCGGDSSAAPEDLAVSAATRQALWAGIAACAGGRTLGDVGAAIEDSVGEGFGILEHYTGHGIGTAMHMEPEVMNYRVQGRTPKLRPGLCIAIEPMCTIGSPDVLTAPDDWTVVTEDGSHGAHWEHTVAIHAGGIWVLTAHDGGVAGLEPFGIAPVPLD